MAVDALVLVVLLLLYVMYKASNRNTTNRRDISCFDTAWIFGKYYALAFLLVFNSNVAFSSFLTLHNFSLQTPIAIANVAFAIIVIIFSAIFFILLITWTKDLSNAVIYPEIGEDTNQVADRMDRLGLERNDRLDRSSAIISMKSRSNSQRQQNRNELRSSNASQTSHPSRD